MSNFLNRLSGYNKNNVKMNVLGSSTANNGDVIQVDLPTNSIVDLSSLAWSFKNTWSVAVAGNDQNHVRSMLRASSTAWLSKSTDKHW